MKTDMKNPSHNIYVDNSDQVSKINSEYFNKRFKLKNSYKKANIVSEQFRLSQTRRNSSLEEKYHHLNKTSDDTEQSYNTNQTSRLFTRNLKQKRDKDFENSSVALPNAYTTLDSSTITVNQIKSSRESQNSSKATVKKPMARRQHAEFSLPRLNIQM